MLPVDYASHGLQVDQLEADILRLLDGVTPLAAQIPDLETPPALARNTT